jgi:hypothetical protein
MLKMSYLFSIFSQTGGGLFPSWRNVSIWWGGGGGVAEVSDALIRICYSFKKFNDYEEDGFFLLIPERKLTRVSPTHVQCPSTEFRTIHRPNP